MLVVDSAYAEFVTDDDYDPGLDLAGMAPNVVMTRTFSKAYGLAALRLGWAYAPPAIIDVLHRIRGPFNVNAAALAAALAALEDQDHIVRSCRHNEACSRCAGRQAHRRRTPGRSQRLQLPAGSLSGRAWPGRCGGRSLSSANAGSSPRRMEPYHLADCLRITVGLEAENEAVAQVLEAFMAAPAAEAGGER